MNKVTLAVFSIALASLVGGCAPITFWTSPRILVPEERQAQAKEAGIPFVFADTLTGTPNSVGGVSFQFFGINTGSKTMKYMTLTVVPYNRVSDQARSSIGGVSEVRVRYTGPLEPGESVDGPVWRNLWYNPTIVCAEITRAEITFMDDDVLVFAGGQIAGLMKTPEMNRCR